MFQATTIRRSTYNTFEADHAARQLNTAFKGWGSDGAVIIDVLASHSNRQRQEIKHSYKTLFKNELADDIESELGGDFESVCRALLYRPSVYDAHCVREALTDSDVDEACLVDIFYSRTNAEVASIRAAYHQEFDRFLEDDITEYSSAELRQLFWALTTSHRNDTDETNEDVAAKDAKDLVTAIDSDEEFSSDSFAFMYMLSHSNSQLQLTYEKFKELVGLDIEEALIKYVKDSPLRKALRTMHAFYASLVAIAKNPAAYFAGKLYDSMKVTDDHTLIRVIVSRSEKDLHVIKEEFKKNYQVSLATAIKKACSGEYGQLLLEIVENNCSNSQQNVEKCLPMPPSLVSKVLSVSEAAKEVGCFKSTGNNWLKSFKETGDVLDTSERCRKRKTRGKNDKGIPKASEFSETSSSGLSHIFKGARGEGFIDDHAAAIT